MRRAHHSDQGLTACVERPSPERGAPSKGGWPGRSSPNAHSRSWPCSSSSGLLRRPTGRYSRGPGVRRLGVQDLGGEREPSSGVRAVEVVGPQQGALRTAALVPWLDAVLRVPLLLALPLPRVVGKVEHVGVFPEDRSAVLRGHSEVGADDAAVRAGERLLIEPPPRCQAAGFRRGRSVCGRFRCCSAGRRHGGLPECPNGG